MVHDMRPLPPRLAAARLVHDVGPGRAAEGASPELRGVERVDHAVVEVDPVGAGLSEVVVGRPKRFEMKIGHLSVSFERLPCRRTIASASVAAVELMPSCHSSSPKIVRSTVILGLTAIM